MHDIRKLSFIGGGNMAAALIGGLIRRGIAPGHLVASDPSEEQLARLASQFAVRTERDNASAVRDAEVVVIAVKPQQIRSVCQALAPALNSRPLVISVAAGIPHAALSRWLGSGIAVVRTMPNRPALNGFGATGLYAPPSVGAAHRALAESIMAAVSATVWVDHESQMDTVTALSGSGPAYFFLFMEALEAAARERGLPAEVADWLTLQQERSELPSASEVLIETFPRAAKHFLVAYPFEGRLAHQTLGMLLTRRLERARLRPLGFVANEYALAVWGLGDVAQRVRRGDLLLGDLFAQDMLGDDLEAWLAESMMMKRTFRTNAVIAGLIQRRSTDREKTRRQVTISTDLIYDVLRKHQPDHLLLRAARADAATGLLDIKRLGEMLSRIRGRIVHKPLEQVSPLAVPVMLEIGRETVYGEASDALLALIHEVHQGIPDESPEDEQDDHKVDDL